LKTELKRVVCLCVAVWHSLYAGVLLRRVSISENYFVKFRYRTFTKDLLCVVYLLPDIWVFLNKGIIMCGVAVTLCIMMAAFSVSVRLCCAGVRSCLRGCWQAGKAGQLIR